MASKCEKANPSESLLAIHGFEASYRTGANIY